MKITKSLLKQIIKEELQSVLLSEAQFNSDNYKLEKWNEFAREHDGSWVEKNGMKAIIVYGDGQYPRFGPRVVDSVGLPYKMVKQESDLTIMTDIPVSGDASSFDTDGDGDVDKLDPDAVRRAIGMGSDNLEYY
jgi:hypothetical protein